MTKELRTKLLILMLLCTLCLLANCKKETILIQASSLKPKPDIASPNVFTCAPVLINGFVITGGMILLNDDEQEIKIVDEGICWSKRANPSLETCGDSITHDGSSLSRFQSMIPNLLAGVYHIRAYAIDTGKKTGYGQDVSITISNGAPAPARVTLMKKTTIEQTFIYLDPTPVAFDSIVFNTDTNAMKIAAQSPYAYIQAFTPGLYWINTTMRTKYPYGNYTLRLTVNGEKIAENTSYVANKVGVFIHLNREDVIRSIMYFNTEGFYSISTSNDTPSAIRLDQYLILPD